MNLDNRLVIERMQDGGFVVGNPDALHNYGDHRPRPYFQFASTTIDKALEYVKDKLATKGKASTS
jgi:hypothetical protein